MLTKDETEIIDVFRRDIFGRYTIRELMKKTGRKTYPWIFNAVKKLGKMGILKIEVKGKSNICSINLSSQLAVSYLALLDETEAASRKMPKASEFLEGVPTPFFTFILGGRPESFCVIADDCADTRRIREALGSRVAPGSKLLVVRKSEFLQMLLSREPNLAKLLFRNRLILFGAKNYYLIIREAIEHGFRGC